MNDREAHVDYPVLDVVRKRWSPCVFANSPLDRSTLRTLFEAARWAPSCYNEQPWYFIIGVQGEGDAHERILNCLVDANQVWAKGAPVLGISVSRLHFQKNGKPNKEAVHDVGLAMGQLVLEAVHCGVAVHQMAGFRDEQTVNDLQIPEGYQPVAAFAIGYLGDPSQAPDALRQRDEGERTRKKQSAFLYEGTFGRPLEG